MTWNNLYIYTIITIALCLAGALFALCNKRFSRAAVILSLCGTLTYAVFIVGFWINIQRPPLRTMGETRLWYSFFVLLAGLITYCIWRYRWILCLSTIMATVFAIINIANPEIHSRVLMPALQSAWFVPHVTIYMFSYALLACSFLLALISFFNKKMNVLSAIDNLTAAGFALFTIAMLFGALWAKQAWGNFWSWDPKETWAAITWFGYILYIHLRQKQTIKRKILYLCIVLSFLSLQMCWYGVNYLPTATQSVHTYNKN